MLNSKLVIDVNEDEEFIFLLSEKRPTISKKFVDLHTGEQEEEIHEETFLDGVLPGVPSGTHYVDSDTIRELVAQDILPDKEIYDGAIWGVIWFNAEDYAKELAETPEEIYIPEFPNSEY